METVAPPGISAFGCGVQATERVDKARIQKTGELGALFIGKARIAAIGARVLQVDLLMGHVEVATHHHGLCISRLTIGKYALLQAFADGTEPIVPGHAVVKARKFTLGIGRVYVYEPVLFEFADHHAALSVQLRHAHLVNYLQRLFLAEHRCTRIAFALGIAPTLVVSRKIHLYLTFLQFRFLEREHIGIKFVEGVHEPLLHNSAQTVNVPGDQSHKSTFQSKWQKRLTPFCHS